MTQTEPTGVPEDDDEVTPVSEEMARSRRQAAADRDKIAKQDKEIRDLRLDGYIRDAGGDPAHPIASMFKETYKGELSGEAVSEAIGGLGLQTPPPAAPSEPSITDAEKGQTAEREAAASGVVPDAGAPTEDPRIVGVKEGLEVMVDGSQEAAIGRFFDRVAHAGYGGDARAQWVPGKEDARRGQNLGW